MLRLFLLALLIWSTLRLAGRVLRQLLSSGAAGARFGQAPGGRGNAAPLAKAGVLSRCPVCGIHFAAGSSSAGEYCSEACRTAAQ
ncbi:MAG: hypothetical protein KDD47_26330 [Acidobacteria bacterium]|nr:hypothetical protein [Acidobacteriota bacterium]